jgi:hypothetical protein
MTPFMRGLKRIRDPAAYSQGFFNRERLSAEPLRQCFTLNKLQHEEAFSFSLFQSIDRSDVGVIERCQEFGFALEAGHSFRISCERVGKELECALAV